MKFRLIVVGKPRDQALAAATAAYELRSARYWPIEVVEIRDESASGKSPDAVRRRDAERIIAACGAATLVACDERGAAMRSEAFARWLQQRRERAQDVAFAIGGAFGLDDAVREHAGTVLALAPWTLSHELARLVLAEQLYRAGTIVRGEPYHK